MPRTSSAVPVDLLAYERVSQLGVAPLEAAGGAVTRAGAALVASRSVGVERIDLGSLGRRLHHHLERVRVLADRVGDVAHAFALAGGAAAGQPVTIDERFLDACRGLPGGRPATLAELASMSYRERLAWFGAFLGSDVVPSDPNFRAVAGVLAAAHASGSGGLWDDDAFGLADAALLESMQLGLAVAASGAGWHQPTGEPRGRAVAAWVEYVSTRGDESDRDAAWARGEEASVRYGESVADAAGLRFGPELEDFIRFSHVYRGAIHRHEEPALLAAIASSLDPEALARLAEAAGEAFVEEVVHVPLGPVDEIVERLVRPIDPFGPLDEFTRLPIIPVIGSVEDMVDQVVRAFAPEALAAMILDPSATPPNLVQSALDRVLGVPAPMPDPPAAYYVGMLIDRGYLVGLPTSLPDVPGAVPRLPGE